MKKIIAFLCCVFLFCVSVSAAPYKAGDKLVTFGLKTAIPALGTDWGEVNIENQSRYMCHDAKLGTMSIGAEAQALYFITNRFAAGVSVGAEFFSQDRASGWEQDVSSFIANYMAVARVYINPEDTYRVYIPVAVGAASTRLTVDMQPNEHFYYTGFATHFGVGVERSLSERGALGLEVRYNTNRFHDSKYIANGDRVTIYPRTNYVSFILRGGWRF